jgi:hypothetical protein
METTPAAGISPGADRQRIAPPSLPPAGSYIVCSTQQDTNHADNWPEALNIGHGHFERMVNAA